MKKKRLIMASVVTAILLCNLAGCGGATSDAGTSTSQEDSATTSSSESSEDSAIVLTSFIWTESEEIVDPILGDGSLTFPFTYQEYMDNHGKNVMIASTNAYVADGLREAASFEEQYNSAANISIGSGTVADYEEAYFMISDSSVTTEDSFAEDKLIFYKYGEQGSSALVSELLDLDQWYMEFSTATIGMDIETYYGRYTAEPVCEWLNENLGKPTIVRNVSFYGEGEIDNPDGTYSLYYSLVYEYDHGCLVFNIEEGLSENSIDAYSTLRYIYYYPNLSIDELTVYNENPEIVTFSNGVTAEIIS